MRDMAVFCRARMSWREMARPFSESRCASASLQATEKG